MNNPLPKPDDCKEAGKQPKTCETCGLVTPDGFCYRADKTFCNKDNGYPYWQPKQPVQPVPDTGLADKQIADALDITGEAYTYKGDGFSVTTLDIHSVLKEQAAHTVSELIKAGWLSPQQVEEKLQEERAKEAGWLKGIKRKTCGCVDMEIIVHIADLERRAGVKHEPI